MAFNLWIEVIVQGEQFTKTKILDSIVKNQLCLWYKEYKKHARVYSQREKNSNFIENCETQKETGRQK